MSTEKQILNEEQLKNKIISISHNSSTFKKLGEFIDKNWNQMIFITATEIANKTMISQGSVSRFFSEVGFKGYSDFINNLKQLARNKSTAPNRLKNIKKNDLDVDKIIKTEQQNLNKLYDVVNKKDFEKLVNALVNYKKIIFLSARISATLLDDIYYSFAKIRNNVSIVTPDTIEWNMITFNDPKDVFIFVVSFPRYPNNLINKVKELKNAGYTIGLVTDSLMSPIIINSDIHIEVPISTISFFDVYSTTMVFFNILIIKVAKNIPGLEDRMNKLETYEKKENIYYKF